jgi:integrase
LARSYSLALPEDNVREGFLEHHQYVLMRDELPDHQKLILVIGYHLGMRRGEILKLRWDQVDWDANLHRRAVRLSPFFLSSASFRAGL